MTKKNTSGNDILKEALRESFTDYYRQFPDSENEIDLGEDYEHYIECLIRRSKNPIRRYFNTAGRRAAGIAAAILIAFGSSMTVSAIREPVIEFFTNMTESYTEIFFDQKDVSNAPERIETVYTLGAVPEGYTQTRFKNFGVAVETAWTNGNGDKISLSQGTLGLDWALDTEESDFIILERNGKKILFSQKYGLQGYYWVFDKYAFYLILPSDISREEAFSFIDSLAALPQ